MKAYWSCISETSCYISSQQYGSQTTSGGVAELADAHDLGSCGEIRAGSSPAFPTK